MSNSSFSSGKTCFSFTTIGYKDNKYRFFSLSSDPIFISPRNTRTVFLLILSAVQNSVVHSHLSFFAFYGEKKKKPNLFITFTFITSDLLNRLKKFFWMTKFISTFLFHCFVSVLRSALVYKALIHQIAQSKV